MVGPVAVQFLNVALVTVNAAALLTSTVNVELVHCEVTAPTSGTVVVNSRSGEWSVCAVPTVPQLDAEAIDGITNAHTAITPAKSTTPFLENFFMTKHSL
jgi:hypothetical protein